MKTRHKRFGFIVAGLAALALATWFIFSALGNNVGFSFSPTQVATKEAPTNKAFRVGGLVEKGSMRRDPDGLTIHFTVTDTVNTVPVVFKETAAHPLPDLFKEGRGCVAQGH